MYWYISTGASTLPIQCDVPNEGFSSLHGLHLLIGLVYVARPRALSLHVGISHPLGLSLWLRLYLLGDLCPPPLSW